MSILSPAVCRTALTLWLRAPRNPRTGRRGEALWLGVPLLVVAAGAREFVPALPHPEHLDFSRFLGSTAGRRFGRWDWLANGRFFAAYHVHRWSGFPGILLDAFLYCLPSRRYRSALIDICVHSVQSVVLLALVLQS